MKKLIFSVVITLITIALALFIYFYNHSNDAKQILIIGNSFSMANDLNLKLSKLANGQDDTAYLVTLVAEPGFTLADHSTDANLISLLKNKHWDYVILQEQSQIPGFPNSAPEKKASNDAIELFAKEVSNKSTHIILFETWAYKNGDDTIREYSTFDTMQSRITSGYSSYQTLLQSNYKGLPATVAGVGSCYGKIKSSKSSTIPFADLYQTDGIHPSDSGSQVAAVILASSILGNSPIVDTNNSTQQSAVQTCL